MLDLAPNLTTVRRRCARVLLALCALAAPVPLSGCAGNCASDCPGIAFSAYATPGETLDVATAQWSGPACPPTQPSSCLFDSSSGTALCVGMVIYAVAPGACKLDLTFNGERAPYSVTAEFGPETHQGCCHGFPVVGDLVVTIPPLHPPKTDAGTDTAATLDTGTDALQPDGSTVGDAAATGSDSGNP